MANTKIGVVGVVELNGKLNNIANVDLKQVLEKCAIKVRDDAKQKVPNRHGELEKSLDYVFEDEYTVAVGTNKAYAPYVEIGTGIWAGINTSGLYSQYAGTGRQTPWAWPATEEDVRDYGVENGMGGYLNARQDKNGQW